MTAQLYPTAHIPEWPNGAQSSIGCFGHFLPMRTSTRPCKNSTQSVRSRKRRRTIVSRFSQLQTLNGSYLTHSRLRTLFVNGLDERISNAVRRFLHDNPRKDISVMLENSKYECRSLRALIASVARKIIPMTLAARASVSRKNREILSPW